MRRWVVSDVMTSDVVSVAEDTAYRAIVDLLAAHRISAVPVVDQARRVIGVVSEADLLYQVEFAGAGPPRRIVPARRRSPREKGEGRVARELMTAPAVTATPDSPLSAAARTMADRGVKRLPVVDAEGVLVGIVARADLLRVHLRSDEELRREIVNDLLRRTLWLDPVVVEVTVREGVVTLRGRLDRRTLARLIARLTAAVPGVVTVQDHLTYELDDADLAASGWYRSHPFSATGPSA